MAKAKGKAKKAKKGSKKMDVAMKSKTGCRSGAAQKAF